MQKKFDMKLNPVLDLSSWHRCFSFFNSFFHSRAGESVGLSLPHLLLVSGRKLEGLCSWYHIKFFGGE